MARWIHLDSQAAIDELMKSFGGFHDAFLRELSAEGPGNPGTSVTLVFESDAATHRTIEIRCEGLMSMRLSPTPNGCDCVISWAVFSRDDDSSRFGFSFIGLPLTGPPGSSRTITREPAEHFEVEARTISWRPASSAP